MATYNFSVQINGQHIAFDPLQDVLSFDDQNINASSVRISISGADLGFTYGDKTVWLDATPMTKLTLTNIIFANGSVLAVGDATTDTLADSYGADYSQLPGLNIQVWGLGGADLVQTGNGADWLVGNVALEPLAHVSRVAGVGSPTPSTNAGISADGRFVGFAGGWTSFGSSSNNGTDVFVKDMLNGAVSNEHRNSAGVNGASGSAAPVISADGTLLAFYSASNLVGNFSGGLYDVYVAEVGSNGITRVSTGTGEVLAADGRSQNPDLSGNGRYVVFESDTSNWAANGSTATTDIFLKDRQDGSLTRISTSLTGGDGNGDSRFARVSADGRFVVFESAASNLTGNDNNGYTDVFIWDRNSGGLINLSSLDPAGTGNPNNPSNLPDVAYDNGWGGAVVFQTAKALVAADTFNGIDIYAFSLFDRTFQLVSSRADGSGVQISSEDASVSGDGRFVVFSSGSDELVPGDSNGFRDVFVKDLYNGRIALVSSAAAAVAANQHSGNAEISSGGEWIVFESGATNLAGSDGNGTFSDVFRVSNPLLLDTLIGGAGDDVYVLSRDDIVQEQASGGTDTIHSWFSYSLIDTDGGGALGGNVENLLLLGTANLNGTGNALDNILTGNSGDNVLHGGAGNDTASYAGAAAAVTVNLGVLAAQSTGGAGTDSLISIENLMGSSFSDTLTGDDGNNVLDGGAAGNDTMAGGAGDDTYTANSDADIITGESAGSGTDTVRTSVTWTLQPTLEHLILTGPANINGSGNSANNQITGNSGNNILTGASGDDTLDGGPGADTMSGGAGDDTYVADSATDIISGESVGSGTDTVRAGVTWTLQPTLENLILTGSSNINGSGNSASNLVIGNSGNNVLNGFSGDDTLNGSTGNDTLGGGSGIDTAIFSGLASAYSIARNGLTTTVSGPDGTDTLTGIEKLQFADVTIQNVGSTGVDASNDYSGDGKSDVLWRNSTGEVALWLMDGLTPTTQAVFGSVPVSMSIVDGNGDFNGDGKSNILWRDSNGDVTVWLMNGITPTAQTLIGSVPNTWTLVDGHGDYNGDGKDDLLWRNSNGDTALWLMNGTAFLGQAVFGSIPTSWSLIDGSGDYNGDGKGDLLWRNSSGDTALWLMNGLTPIGQAVFGSVPITWNIVDGHGDYNGDGNSDLLWRNSTGDVALWLMNGLTPIGQAVFGSVPTTWSIVEGHGDYNGDGNSDVLWRNSNGDVALWLMNGVTPIGQAVFASVPNTWTIVDGHSDYNGDGKDDLLWRNSNGDVAQWLMSGLTPIGQAVFASVPTTWSITTELGGLLSGDGAADTLTGTTARDTLVGNGGADTLAGGSGADTFAYNATTDSTVASSDRITDFAHGIDKIDLTLIDANTITAGDQAFLFGGNNVNTVANSVTWSEGGGNTTLRIDNTGDTTADMLVVLTGVGLALTAADFGL